MAHAHKGKKKVSKAMGAILKAPKKVEKTVKHTSKHWNNLEDFRKSVVASGIDLNVEEEYEFFKSDPEKFKRYMKYLKDNNFKVIALRDYPVKKLLD